MTKATDTDTPDLTFSLEILLSEPLEFDLAEIVAAVDEDYPANAVTVSPINPKTMVKTDDVVMALLTPVDPENGQMITFTGAGFPDDGFRAADNTELAWRSGPFAEGALHAIKTYESYVTLSVKASDASLAARFRAARQLTAVAAVFAQLPITLGVLVHWTSHMVAPEVWVKAAQRASQDQWPLTEWISYRAGWDVTRGQQTEYAVGYTVGLSRFLDWEFHMEAAPIQPSDVLQMLMGACYLPLQGGSNCRDGDTMGVEGSDLKYTMRRRNASHGGPGKTVSLLHPQSPLDEEAEFGPNPLAKAPEGFDNSRWPKPGFMKKILGKARTLH